MCHIKVKKILYRSETVIFQSNYEIISKQDKLNLFYQSEVNQITYFVLQLASLLVLEV